MPKKDKPGDKQNRQAVTNEPREAQKGAPRPEAESRAWAAANKRHGGGKKGDARRKLPSGPLGGSGRKTNGARSS